jgi:hypothetical protein
MASFTGFLQADGYAGFEGLYNPARTKPGPITEVACLAHCRRKFYDVWEATKSPVAKEALDRIAAVYAIEDKARFANIARFPRSTRAHACVLVRNSPMAALMATPPAVMRRGGPAVRPRNGSRIAKLQRI